MNFHIGYAQAVITPPLERPVYLAGFGQNRRAQLVHDELYVRGLALVAGETRLVVLALDLLGYGRARCRAVEARLQQVYPGVKLLIACTHTHHGPDTIGLWGPDETTSGVDLVYMEWLAGQIEATARGALATVRPAGLRQTAVSVPHLAKNGRDPHILDEELTCLQFTDLESGAAVANWLIYPCHPEVLWDDNPAITSDYMAAMRQEVEAATGAPCVGLVGALGGMMTPDVVDHSFAEAEAMGWSLARAALDSWQGVATTAVSHFSYQRHEFAVPMENPLFEMARGVGLLETAVRPDGTLLTEASLLRLNGAWLLGVPGELLPKLGLAYRQMMKEAGGENTAVIGLANDELGYILPAEDFVPPTDYFAPGSSYEESMSVSAQLGPALTDALRQLLGML